ncbi:MAG: type IV pilus assembly protein PilM [Candidatus Omnitrophota bacterium]
MMLKKQKTAFGVDIGSYSVKALGITQEGPQFWLSAIETEKILGSDKPAIVSALKKVVAAGNMASLPVGVAISGQFVIVRTVVLPMMTNDELRSSLTYEAEKHIPFKISEMQLDFKVLASGLPENKMKVLLVGAKKETIEETVANLEAAGLLASFIDIDGFASVNALEFAAFTEAQNKTCAVLDVGHKLANITVVSNFSPFFLRDISIAGADIILFVKTELGVSFEEAENLLKNPGDAFTSTQAAMRSVMERLAGEIRASFDYCESQSEVLIEKVFLSGGCANFAGFATLLKEMLGMEVVQWKPLSKLLIPPQLKVKALGAGSEMAVAAGLAIRNVK